MSKKQKCVCSADLLSSVDKALNALDKSRKHAKKQKKFDKKAIAALLELEARIEDSDPCKGKNTKKKKSKKKAGKISAVQQMSGSKDDEALAVSNILGLQHKSDDTADDLEMIAGI